jgi:hypothetical protein
MIRAAQQDLQVTRGGTFDEPIELWEDKAHTEPWPIEGWEFALHIASSEIVLKVGAGITLGGANSFTVELTPEQTQGLKGTEDLVGVEKVGYFLQISKEGKIYFLLKGNIVVENPLP